MGNNAKTFFWMIALMALCLWIGDLIGGKVGLVYAFVFGSLGNIIAYFFSHRIVLMMYGAKSVSESELPEVYRVVSRLAPAAGMPMPKVYLMDTPMPNAFATGRSPKHAVVAVTTGILKLLNERELEGVLGHELSHIKHRDILIGTMAAILAGAIYTLARVAQWTMWFGAGRGDDRDNRGNAAVLMLVAILAPFAAMLIQMAISRSREYEADRGGAKLTHDPMSLASALRKIAGGVATTAPYFHANPTTAHLFIISPLTGGSLLHLFSTHPPVAERVKRLEAMTYGG